MARMIFINLPVTDLGRSRASYEAIGYFAAQAAHPVEEMAEA